MSSISHLSALVWVVSQLAHSSLARWRFPDDPAFAAWIAAQARGWGLLDDLLIDDAVRRCRSLLNRFRAHPLYAQMTAADQCLHEVPYALPVGERLDAGVIDALFRQNGVWTIVEFKSDKLKDEVERDTLLLRTDYLAQVARYRRAVKTLLGGEPQVALCWLNLGRQVVVQWVTAPSV